MLRKKFDEMENLITTDNLFSTAMYLKIHKNNIVRLSAPIKIGLKITDDCLFRCPYCFVNKNHNNMSSSSLEKIFNKLPQLPLEVYLTGGEPTRNPYFKDIVEYLYSNKIQIKLHTTGLMSLETQDYIIKNSNKFKSIQVSIDSIKNFDKIRISKEATPFIKITNFIREVINIGNDKIIVNTVLSKLNKNDIDDIIDFVSKENVKAIRFTPIFSNDKNLTLNDHEDFNFYYHIITYAHEKQLKILGSPTCHPWSFAQLNELPPIPELFCPAQKTEFEIDPKGDVYPCPFLHYSKYKMGNLLVDDFEKVWHGGVEELNKTKWSEDITCKKCPVYVECGGGCYAMAELNEKKFDTRCIINES